MCCALCVYIDAIHIACLYAYLISSLASGDEVAGLVPWVGGVPDAAFGFYLREAFQSQNITDVGWLGLRVMD